MTQNKGTTFSSNLGPVFAPTAATSYPRYPMGMIWNKPGNTNPDSARIVWHTAGVANLYGIWGGYAWGSAKLGDPVGSATSATDTQAAPFPYEIPNAMALNGNGEMIVGQMTVSEDSNGDFTFADITLGRGVVDPVTGVVTFTRQNISVPFSQSNAASPFYPTYPTYSLAFGPDGLTGYFVFFGHIDYALEPEQVQHPIVLKTTDGGITWGAPTVISTSQFTALAFPGAPANIKAAAGNRDLDTYVDANGNLHLALSLVQSNTSNVNFVQSDLASESAVYHIYTNNAGLTYQADLLRRPMSRNGRYGLGTNQMIENLRLQISVSPDNNRVAFVWGETDTALFADANVLGLNNAGQGNVHPDLYVKGYDISTGVYTDLINVSDSIPGLDNAAHQMVVAPVGFTTSTVGEFEIPIVAVVPGPNGLTVATTPCSFVYVDNLVISNASFAASSFSSDFQSVCVGDTVTLTDLSTNGPDSVFFLVNGDTILTPAGGTAQVAFTAPGSYDVKLITYNGGVISDSLVQAGYISVVTQPVPVIQALGATSFCDGGSVGLLAPAGFSSYLWTTGDTTQGITANATGVYGVTVSTATGCTGTSVAVAVTEFPVVTPTIVTSGPATLCANGTVYLTTSQPYATYLWSNGETTDTIFADSVQNLTVTVTDSNGCQGTSALYTVQAGNVPTPIISYNLADSIFCFGDSVLLTAPAGFADYAWSNGTNGQTLYVFDETPVFVTVLDSNGCSGTSPSVVFQVDTVTPVLATPAVVVFCPGTSLTVPGPTGFASIEWYLNGVPTGQTGSTYTINQAGNLSVLATNANGCTGLSNSVGFGVFTVDTALITYNTQNDQFTVVGNNTNKSFQWFTTISGGNPLVQPVPNSNSFFLDRITDSPLVNGYFVIVTDSNGCVDTSNTLFIAGAADGLLTQGVDFTVYPNPATTTLNVSLVAMPKTALTISLRDAAGREVRRQILPIGTTLGELNIDGLQSGLYFVELQGEGVRAVAKVIKE